MYEQRSFSGAALALVKCELWMAGLQGRHSARKMSKNCIAPRSLTLALAALLAATAPLRSLDVSHFLSPESAADLPSGSPASIAYDGTNFLIAARSTNGGIMAFRLATNAMMQGTRLDLCRTGGPPRVAFDGR